MHDARPPVERLRKARRSARLDRPPFLVIVAFATIFGAFAAIRRLPGWVVGLYASTSIACALAYLVDKSAAAHQRLRVPERTLLWLGLVGGWPGAIVAQQLLRHKTSKKTFRTRFWLTVVANVIAFIALGIRWEHLPRLSGG